MRQFDQGWAEINRPVFHKSYSDRVQARFLRFIISCYKFEKSVAINPKIIHGLSVTITRLEGDLKRLEIR